MDEHVDTWIGRAINNQVESGWAGRQEEGPTNQIETNKKGKKGGWKKRHTN